MIRWMIGTVLSGLLAHKLDLPIDEWFPVSQGKASNRIARFGFDGAIVFVMYLVMIWDQLEEPERRIAAQCLFTTFGLVGFGMLFGNVADRIKQVMFAKNV